MSSVKASTPAVAAPPVEARRRTPFRPLRVFGLPFVQALEEYFARKVIVEGDLGRPNWVRQVAQVHPGVHGRVLSRRSGSEKAENEAFIGMSIIICRGVVSQRCTEHERVVEARAGDVDTSQIEPSRGPTPLGLHHEPAI
ncbi:hypothetical protein HYQ46_013115 [Verticillium longisporum]|nr:hypothetical protein HYQ46_013115 [Verticillium longisporum]